MSPKAGFRYRSGSVTDVAMVYDQLGDLLAMFRSMDRPTAEAFRDLLMQNKTSLHGPVGEAVAGVLIDFLPAPTSSPNGP